MQDFCGESLGTFILVFFGCGSVAVSVLFSAYQGLFQVAAIWGIGVTLAIYASRGLSCAHLNPAVSIAFVCAKRMLIRKLPVYLIAQFTGAFLAGLLLYLIFSGSITQFESAHNIMRGSSESVRTAMMFGEYFPNPTIDQAVISVTGLTAFIAEGLGAFLLIFFIFFLTEGCNVGRPDSKISPVFIGAAVAGIISIIAPLTQAGLNPARDFGPRLVAYLAGWGEIAIPGPKGGFFVVYILAPVLGGILAAFIFTKIIQPLMESKAVCGKDCCEKN
ncbi:MAG: aquaporin family protein [Candidatus Omnitrophica bacterium]|nr:aquaporin family protein [Candidatus Omnitrophota bacterium]MBU1923974.1 aquaporin family protein [Candidatus Omnitrophota bacterium]